MKLDFRNKINKSDFDCWLDWKLNIGKTQGLFGKKVGERVSSNLDRRSENGRLRMIGDIYVFPSYLGICFCKEKGKKTYADAIKARYEVIKANNDVIKLRKQGKAPDGGHGRRWC